jgi:hypothetical protein
VKRVVDSIKRDATGESYGGASEVSEDVDDEEMNGRCTKVTGCCILCEVEEKS